MKLAKGQRLSYYWTILAAASLILASCVTPEVKPTEPPPKVNTTLYLPSLRPVENYPQEVEKAGIRISVEPHDFTVIEQEKTECEILPTFLVINNQYNYQVRSFPHYEISPRQIRFKVRITNNLNHVLRLAGTVVSFQVNSKIVAVDQAGYRDLMQGIILPRQEAEFQIVGPMTNALSDNSPVALLIYDVVTKTDAAGNPLERNNFEWYFVYKKDDVVKTDDIKVMKASMTAQQANEVCGKIMNK